MRHGGLIPFPNELGKERIQCGQVADESVPPFAKGEHLKMESAPRPVPEWEVAIRAKRTWMRNLGVANGPDYSEFYQCYLRGLRLTSHQDAVQMGQGQVELRALVCIPFSVRFEQPCGMLVEGGRAMLLFIERVSCQRHALRLDPALDGPCPPRLGLRWPNSVRRARDSPGESNREDHPQARCLEGPRQGRQLRGGYPSNGVQAALGRLR